jgi:hypothetical protein
VAVLLLFAATAVGAEPAYVTDRQGQRPGPIVAVDNVCAWPNLTVLRDGTIIASIFGQPSHGTTAGDMECWASEDGGATWTKRGVPAVREHEDSNRIHVAAGLANNGDLLAITTGWTGRDLSGKETGRPFRERIESTWISRSTDDAKTWNHRKKLTDAQQHPGHLTRLSDNRLLVTYGNRTSPGGVDVRFSSDEGLTWSDPLRVVACEGDRGYPSSVQLPDGQVLTAYYAQRIEGHDRYHMGVVVWDLPK